MASDRGLVPTLVRISEIAVIELQSGEMGAMRIGKGPMTGHSTDISEHSSCFGTVWAEEKLRKQPLEPLDKGQGLPSIRFT